MTRSALILGTGDFFADAVYQSRCGKNEQKLPVDEEICVSNRSPQDLSKLSQRSEDIEVRKSLPRCRPSR